jgi:VanZ family protein
MPLRPELGKSFLPFLQRFHAYGAAAAGSFPQALSNPQIRNSRLRIYESHIPHRGDQRLMKNSVSHRPRRSTELGDGLWWRNPLQAWRMQPSSVQPDPVRPVATLLRYWLPVLVWMALIFSASADTQSSRHSSLFFEPLLRWLFPTMPPEMVGALHHVFRKTCHLTEYAVLAWLFWRALRKPVKHDPRQWRWDEAGLALAVVFAYAASDEFHQIFVPNRTPLVSDVLIDSTGGLAGLLLLWLRSMVLKPAAAGPADTAAVR